MDDLVKSCVSARVDFFQTYCEVPAGLRGEVDAFCGEVIALGEGSADATEFEARFASLGFSDRFNSLVTKCTPVAVAMTQEQQAASRKLAQELTYGDAKGFAREVLTDAVDSLRVEAEEEAISQRRKAMIETGVYDDYTRATNLIEDAQGAVGFLKGMFRKK